MFRHLLRRFAIDRQSVRAAARHRRLSCIEGLEGRCLLSGNPTVFTVDLLSDTGTGSGSTGDLLYGVTQANLNTNPAGSIIQFDSTIFTATTPRSIVLAHTLHLTGTAGPIAVDGPGADAVVVSGNNAVTVFSIGLGVTASLSGLTIASGRASGNGGAIFNEASLTLSNCFISDNVAVDSGGGIENDGTMTVSDCTVAGNTAQAATGYGGGIDNSGSLSLIASTVAGNQVSGGNGYGGGLSNTGTLTVQTSEIDDNSLNHGDGGGLFNNGTAIISLSLFDSNTTGNSGSGGGIDNESQLVLTNSTIADNTAGTAGAGVDNNDTLEAVNVTIAGNAVSAAGGGGGLASTTATTTLDNTIVAQNSQHVGILFSPDDIAGTVSLSSADNLIGIGGSGGLTGGTNGNQVGVASPGLGTLAPNGGPTDTIALLPGSPASGAGSVGLAIDPTTGQPLATDQRGPTFARVFDGKVDIGAYEAQPASVVAVSVSWGSQTAALQTAADGLRLLPAGRNTDLPWLGIDELSITLNQAETLSASEISIVGIRGTNYGPATVSGSGMSYTITFARPITKADRVTITIATAAEINFNRRLDVLPGDFFDVGVVTNKDITAIRNEWKGKHGAMPTIFGEITGDGTVKASDFKAARKFQGDRLPKLPKTGGKPPKVFLESTLARQHDTARRNVRSV